MKRVSMSQINSWMACRQGWSYRYKDMLTKPEQAVYMASGKAIHGTMEAIIKKEIPFSLKHEKAEQILRENLEWREDIDEQVAKFFPGTQRALERIPDWVWEEDWMVEKEIEWTWTWEDMYTEKDVDEEAVTLFGIPDLVVKKDDCILLAELKSTSNTSKIPLDYLLFNPQHRYYSVIIRKIYGDELPIYVRYGVVQTGKGGNSMTSEWLMKTSILDLAEGHMVAAAREIGKLPIVPYYSGACGFCDYKELCIPDITGAKDKESVKGDLFVRRDMV